MDRMKSPTLIFLILAFAMAKVDGQIITTVVGKDTCGDSGDGGIAINAEIDGASGGTFDRYGTFYFEQLNGRVRKVDTNGIITTIAGNGTTGFSGDGGPATNAQLHQPAWVEVDSVGNIYIADVGNHRIRKVDTLGIIHTIAGNGMNAFGGDNGPAINASLLAPNCIRIDKQGNLYEVEYSRIRKIDTNGIIRTIIGNGTPGYSGDNGPADQAEINAQSFFIDDQLNFFIADYLNQRVRKVDAATGIITTIAGNGVGSYGGDGGPATAAGIRPFVVTFNSIGELFIADMNQRIRKVDASGIITTVTGTGVGGNSGDGGPATDAKIYNPEGLVFDGCDNMYVTLTQTCRVRKIAFNTACFPERLESVKEEKRTLLFPNPATNELSLAMPENTKKCRLIIFNTVGQKVSERTIEAAKYTVNISSLMPGVYVAVITDDRGTHSITNFIKE